jgi:hypothetical protein
MTFKGHAYVLAYWSKQRITTEVNEPLNERLDERLDERLSEWMNEWTNGDVDNLNKKVR